MAEFAPVFIDKYARANQEKPSSIKSKESILALYILPELGQRRLDSIVTVDSGVGSRLHEPFNPLTLLDLSEAVGVRPTRLLSPFPGAFGPTLVQETPRKATAVQFMTVGEVAAKFRVSPATVYALCAKGKLPHVRISNSLRIASENVEAFLRRRDS